MNIGSVNFATKYAKATAVTVYLMTGVKALVRPSFNLADKKSDKDSRKYSAANEFLYQIVCLGFAAAMIPVLERTGFKLAEKKLGKLVNSSLKKIEEIDEFKELANIKGINLAGSKKVNKFKKIYLKKSFDEDFVSKVKTAKDKIENKQELTAADKKILEADKAMHLVNGGVEAGSFIASIVGLTILAPKIGHEILHPIMHKLGMGKQDHKDHATEELTANVLPEDHHPVNLKA